MTRIRCLAGLLVAIVATEEGLVSARVLRRGSLLSRSGGDPLATIKTQTIEAVVSTCGALTHDECVAEQANPALGEAITGYLCAPAYKCGEGAFPWRTECEEPLESVCLAVQKLGNCLVGPNAVVDPGCEYERGQEAVIERMGAFASPIASIEGLTLGDMTNVADVRSLYAELQANEAPMYDILMVRNWLEQLEHQQYSCQSTCVLCQELGASATMSIFVQRDVTSAHTLKGVAVGAISGAAGLVTGGLSGVGEGLQSGLKAEGGFLTKSWRAVTGAIVQGIKGGVMTGVESGTKGASNAIATCGAVSFIASTRDGKRTTLFSSGYWSGNAASQVRESTELGMIARMLYPVDQVNTDHAASCESLERKFYEPAELTSCAQFSKFCGAGAGVVLMPGATANECTALVQPEHDRARFVDLQ